MPTLPYTLVDVFTDRPTFGNPLAVVHDATDIPDDLMQRFCDWTNLSEVTFLLPPTDPAADYRVRIFSPGRELPFAGHPTLGSAFAWLLAGGVPKGERVVQECGVGLVPVRRAPGGAAGPLAFAAPPLRDRGPMSEADLARLAAFLRVPREAVEDAAWCVNGPEWRAVLLRSAEEVLALRPDPALQDGMDVGVVGPHPAGGDVAFEVRSFFPGAQGMTEDPVTGSLNAGLAQWLIGSGRAPERYVAAQGTAMGRAGRIFVERADGETWIGGHSVAVARGSATL
ncbi:MAG: PhzF family phenazine biosynthesis protein [Chloroflexota bacterium]